MNDISVTTAVCPRGALLPIAAEGSVPPLPCPMHIMHGYFPGMHRAAWDFTPGAVLCLADGTPQLRVETTLRTAPPPFDANTAPPDTEDIYPFTAAFPLVRALCDIRAQTLPMTLRMPRRTAAVITLSDKGCTGERIDTCGPALADAVSGALPSIWVRRFMLPDEPDLLRGLVCDLAFVQRTSLIITTGGTGLSPRDTTPESLIPLLSRRLEGMEHAMMQNGLTHTPRAALSRCMAGCIGTSLILALPGSRKAALENIAPVLPILEHASEKLGGDTTDCGRV